MGRRTTDLPSVRANPPRHAGSSMGQPSNAIESAVLRPSGSTRRRLPSRTGLHGRRCAAGFNWGPFEGTQLPRRCTGVFTGRPAYAWLANAFQNTGDRPADPGLPVGLRRAGTLDPGANRRPPSASSGLSPDVYSPGHHLLRPGLFVFPQDLRTMIAVDQRLPGGLVAVRQPAVQLRAQTRSSSRTTTSPENPARAPA